MQRAKKMFLTVVGFAALSLSPACAMMEDGDGDNIDEIDHIDEVGTDPYAAKTFVCHRAGTRAAPDDHVIEIALMSLPSHLGHGDIVGAVCPAVCVPGEEICGDGIDQNCDGIDPICPPDPPDCTPTQEICGDSLDNDCDDRVDNGCIGDHAWLDDSRDGIQDDGETAFVGAVFILRDVATDTEQQRATSDTNGNYYFSGVATGEYYIEVQLPTGYRAMPLDATTDERLDSDFDVDGQVTAPFTFEAAGTNYDIDCGINVVGGG